jgi:predicted nucleotidyltransferase
MTNSSENSFRELAIPHFLEVFQLIDEVVQRHQLPYYLIGANAIALKLLQQGIKPNRGTKDIDFAIMVSSFDEYDSIKKGLMEKGFNKVEFPYTLYHTQYNVAIDLLPFGKIEEQYTEDFHKREVDIVVLGFRETLEEAEEISLTEPLVVKVPPLHGMCILKLIAWSDRPEHRGTDLEDIYHIIHLYFENAYDEILEVHPDLLDREPFDEKMIAARVLGRKIAPILEKSEAVKKRIFNVLDKNIRATDRSRIAEHWARKYDLEVDYALQLLTELRAGIAD